MAKDKNLTPDSYKYEIEALARDIIDESKRFTEILVLEIKALLSVGIGNSSHTPIIESNTSDMSISYLYFLVNFRKKMHPVKGA